MGEGLLEFEHGQSDITLTIEIPQSSDKEAPNGKMFQVVLDNAHPRAVKIKRDTLIVEMVADIKEKKQADAL